MKKLILLLFSVAIVETAFCQKESFFEDSRNFDIKVDFAGYNATLTNNQTDSVESSMMTTAVILSPQMAWAVSRAVSIGWSVGLSHYLNDSSSAQLNGLDGNFIVDVHFVRTPRTDMMLGLKMGLGGIRLDPYDGTGDVYGSLGLTGDVHLMARFYLTNRLAIIANLGVPGYAFNKFGKNLEYTHTIKLNGVLLGTGIAMKLYNQRTAGTQRNK